MSHKLRSDKAKVVLLFLSVAVLLTVLPAVAGTTQPVAKLQSNETTIFFDIQIPYERLMMTVSGPGTFYHREELTAGEGPPAFEIGDAAGDGLYTYELRVVPELGAEVREALEAARSTGNKDAVRALEAEGKLPPALVQSGFFSMRDSIFVDVGAEEEAASSTSPRGKIRVKTAPTTHQGDTFIQGSLCAGSSTCDDSSITFDDDTVIIADDVIRVFFDDTDTTGTAKNDWRFIFNGETSGSYFAIEDTSGSKVVFNIEAGARANAIYVDDDDNIGFGTATPQRDVHIVTDATPTLRLEQDGTGAGAAQSWDIAADDDEFSIQDATGSTEPFKIATDAPTNSLVISSSGKIGVGTSSPLSDIHIKPTTTNQHAEIRLTARDENQDQTWKFRSNYVNYRFAIIDDDGSTSPFVIEAGTPSQMLHIATTGVGINTSSPNSSAALDVNGAIYQSGSVLHADYVFEPDYELESIEEHARSMWEEKHLPAVPARTVNEQGQEYIEIGAQQRGILEELEKAHIYIEQLNNTLKERDQVVTDLKNELGELYRRLVRLEASTN